ncbi:hypothetical protein SRHO_G00334650 [Serrasalmus rhombeus]
MVCWHCRKRGYRLETELAGKCNPAGKIGCCRRLWVEGSIDGKQHTALIDTGLIGCVDFLVVAEAVLNLRNETLGDGTSEVGCRVKAESQGWQCSLNSLWGKLLAWVKLSMQNQSQLVDLWVQGMLSGQRDHGIFAGEAAGGVVGGAEHSTSAGGWIPESLVSSNLASMNDSGQ